MHHQYNKYCMNKSLFKKTEKGFSEKTQLRIHVANMRPHYKLMHTITQV